MRSRDSIQHVRGESRFVDDLPEPAGTLYAAVYPSPIAHGTVQSLDTAAASAVDGVAAVLTAADIPGENQIGGIVPDEELLASAHVHFIGQPLALVVAASARAARAGMRALRSEITPLPVITDPREAQRRGELIIPLRVMSCGDVDAAWAQCDVIVTGRADSGGQEHLYLETQGSLAWPTEDGGLKIVSSTQGPTAVQRMTARVLGIPMHRIEVEVARLGGGFGGKEDQATPWAVLAALAAQRLNRPVKLILPRQADMRMTGKRHPYSADYKIGLTKTGQILAYDVTFYQNAGAAADLSPAVLDRTLFHCTNSYFVPNVRATGYSCRTNLPPNTAFRGFGGPQGMFVIEAAIHHAARTMGLAPHTIQRANLLPEGGTFPYGQRAELAHAINCWDEAARRFDLPEWEARIAAFNRTQARYKKGLAVMPVCFGISFTATFLNQASALVHVYTDGSVGISTAAVEMGQGVNVKMAAVAARVFGIDPQRIRIETTNTTRVANTSPTAASKGADLNGAAVQAACTAILRRLQAVAATELGATPEGITVRDERICRDGDPTSLMWVDVVQRAYVQRISLSAQAHHATPDLAVDREQLHGKPFAYHSYGVGIVEATVDGLRGTYEIDAVKVVHDVGESLHVVTDRGQMEGGIAQGIGWMTVEEVLYDTNGRLLTDALSTYKVPDIHSVPRELVVHFLENVANPHGPFHSKAIGEPPLMYGIGAYFAIRNAMHAFAADRDFAYHAPMTHERVLMQLCGAPESTTA